MSPFSQFVEDFHRYATQCPNARAFLGLDSGLGALPDPSIEAGQNRAAEARALGARSKQLAETPLPFDQRLDTQLAGLRLESDVLNETLQFNGATRREQLPRAGDEIGDGVYLLFANDPRPAGDRLEDITSRLEAVPACLASLEARLGRPVARWAGMDVTKISGRSR